ncbi:MAG: carbohydrate ABC transporter permease [Clostridium sp.]|uniref:carbohydrate ABC transporter permease n=1 Tax=Clostridium sp. TaxID=1506 RepID=UPI001EB50427|nr:carbohydrate ABC transporter permease [Clostridium sp.]MBS5884479.1 carbohydrate ABC transporter permease [Clostridium sp.]MDU7147796.1 carbohydrate ABC transporter permease [Clostridium sp.]MDU7241687.1 carbohydrate ABC transporter permease [Clostridium sp.]
MKLKKKKNKIEAFDIVLILIMLFILVITLYPFLNVLAISFNDATDTVRGGIHIWPREFTLQNYKEVFSGSTKLPRAFVNSVLRTVIGTVTGVIATTMVAFTLSRRDFVFNKLVTILFIVTMYVGGGLIPEYLVIRQLGLVNNFAVYILPGLISAFNVIVIRSFMDGLPEALYESASIDGANDWVVFTKIVFPLCLPVIATVALFIAVSQWNSWFDTYIYARTNDSLTTLQYELMKIMDNAAATVDIHNPNLQNTARSNPESIKMAITMVATVPILLVYPFVQKYFVSGMTLGAVKS